MSTGLKTVSKRSIRNTNNQKNSNTSDYILKIKTIKYIIKNIMLRTRRCKKCNQQLYDPEFAKNSEIRRQKLNIKMQNRKRKVNEEETSQQMKRCLSYQ